MNADFQSIKGGELPNVFPRFALLRFEKFLCKRTYTKAYIERIWQGKNLKQSETKVICKSA